MTSLMTMAFWEGEKQTTLTSDVIYFYYGLETIFWIVKIFIPVFYKKMNQNWILSLFFLMQGRANPSSPNTLPLLQLKGIMQGFLGRVVVWVPISTSSSNQTLRIKTKKKTFSL